MIQNDSLTGLTETIVTFLIFIAVIFAIFLSSAGHRLILVMLIITHCFQHNLFHFFAFNCLYMSIVSSDISLLVFEISFANFCLLQLAINRTFWHLFSCFWYVSIWRGHAVLRRGGRGDKHFQCGWSCGSNDRESHWCDIWSSIAHRINGCLSGDSGISFRIDGKKTLAFHASPTLWIA